MTRDVRIAISLLEMGLKPLACFIQGRSSSLVAEDVAVMNITNAAIDVRNAPVVVEPNCMSILDLNQNFYLWCISK